MSYRLEMKITVHAATEADAESFMARLSNAAEHIHDDMPSVAWVSSVGRGEYSLTAEGTKTGPVACGCAAKGWPEHTPSCPNSL
jgi:hypothetical protein